MQFITSRLNINEIYISFPGHKEENELDARIRRIQEKNEAIMRRKREIEMDKQKYGS